MGGVGRPAAVGAARGVGVCLVKGGVPVLVGVAVGVPVEVAVPVGVALGVPVAVAVAVGLTVPVGVAVDVAVGEPVGVGVGVPHGTRSCTSSMNIPVRSPKSSSWTRNLRCTVCPAKGVISTVSLVQPSVSRHW